MAMRLNLTIVKHATLAHQEHFTPRICSVGLLVHVGAYVESNTLHAMVVEGTMFIRAVAETRLSYLNLKLDWTTCHHVLLILCKWMQIRHKLLQVRPRNEALLVFSIVLIHSLCRAVVYLEVKLMPASVAGPLGSFPHCLAYIDVDQGGNNMQSCL